MAKKVEVIATAKAKFAKPGTRRKVAGDMARALVLLKQAEIVEAPAAPEGGYERRDMQPRRAPGRPRKVTGVLDIPSATAHLNDPRTTLDDGEA